VDKIRRHQQIHRPEKILLKGLSQAEVSGQKGGLQEMAVRAVDHMVNVGPAERGRSWGQWAMSGV
jgi:hypothetical protein